MKSVTTIAKLAVYHKATGYKLSTIQKHHAERIKRKNFQPMAENRVLFSIEAQANYDHHFFPDFFYKASRNVLLVVTMF